MKDGGEDAVFLCGIRHIHSSRLQPSSYIGTCKHAKKLAALFWFSKTVLGAGEIVGASCP
jgi:hypothetical protein